MHWELSQPWLILMGSVSSFRLIYLMFHNYKARARRTDREMFTGKLSTTEMLTDECIYFRNNDSKLPIFIASQSS